MKHYFLNASELREIFDSGLAFGFLVMIFTFSIAYGINQWKPQVAENKAWEEARREKELEEKLYQLETATTTLCRHYKSSATFYGNAFWLKKGD